MKFLSKFFFIKLIIVINIFFSSSVFSENHNIYEVLDANNCLYVDSVFIDQPLPLSVNESVNNVLCYGDNSGSPNQLPKNLRSSLSLEENFWDNFWVHCF